MEIKDLIGKTIIGADIKRAKNYDDEGYLVFQFSDGTETIIIGGYSECYTGKSQGEYPTSIGIANKMEVELEKIEL